MIRIIGTEQIQEKSFAKLESYCYDAAKEFNLKEGGSTSDEGDGKVGLPVDGHTFIANNFVCVKGSQNYDGNHKVVDIEENKVIITATYVSETFAGSEKIYLLNAQTFTVNEPDKDNLQFSKTVIVPKTIASDTPGLAHTDGIHIIEEAGGETIDVWDKVGTKQDDWKAKRSIKGPFTVIAKSGSNLALRPTIRDENIPAIFVGGIPDFNTQTNLWGLNKSGEICRRFAAGNHNVEGVVIDRGKNAYVGTYKGCCGGGDINLDEICKTLWAVDRYSTLLWRTFPRQVVSIKKREMAIDKDGYPYIITAGGAGVPTIKLDKSDGEAILQTYDEEGMMANCLALDVDDYVYVGGQELDPGVVRTLWKFSNGGVLQPCSFNAGANVLAMAVKDGFIYQGAFKTGEGQSDATVYKINSNGVEQWHYNTQSKQIEAITVDDDGNVYVAHWRVDVGGYRNLVKLNSSGAFQWSFDTGSIYEQSTFDVDVADGAVYVVGSFVNGASLWARNASDGSHKWKVDPGDGGGLFSVAAKPFV